MSVKAELFWHKYRYFPYERVFALREVNALFALSPDSEHSDRIVIIIPETMVPLIDRLTYFWKARVGRNWYLPKQSRLELGIVGPFLVASELTVALRRQSTRYSAHGLHEYRGKFHPQVVRSIGNQIALQPGSWILDPFCGSGTTLLEAIHNGWNAVGTDINPLAVEIAKAKLVLAHVSSERLRATFSALRSSLEKTFAGLRYDESWPKRVAHRLRMGLPNLEYLEAWFPSAVLMQLGELIALIDDLPDARLRRVFRVIVSDIAREVSLQEPADLRIRRRKAPEANYPAVPRFLERADAIVASVTASRAACNGADRTKPLVFEADNRQGLVHASQQVSRRGRRHFDAAITSPPYATALPYIDTQRLSLCLLGLRTPTQVRTLERDLIGSREYSGRQELRQLGQAITERAAEAPLPESTFDLCAEMLSAAGEPGNGFRRRAVPGLVYRYLQDMSRTMAGVLTMIRPGGTFALVLGRNTTTLGGTEFVIDTPRLLADIAELQGWKVADSIELETFQRFDLHSQNSIRNENLLLLQRP